MRSKAETRSDVASEDNWTIFICIVPDGDTFTAKVHIPKKYLNSEIKISNKYFKFRNHMELDKITVSLIVVFKIMQF